MTERIFNFNAGPAVLPLPVLEEIQINRQGNLVVRLADGSIKEIVAGDVTIK